MSEAINDCTKILACAVQSLKAELESVKPNTWNTEMNINEVIVMLEEALDKLLNGK